jgi:hypothetical protein
VIDAVAPVPEELVACTVNVREPAAPLATVQVAVVRPVQPVPVQTYEVGWFVQFELIVVARPAAGAEGCAVGAHTGTPPPPPPLTQVTVCAPAGPEMVKLVQLGLVYVMVALMAAGGVHDTAIASTAATAAPHIRVHETIDAIFKGHLPASVFGAPELCPPASFCVVLSDPRCAAP